MKTWSHAVLFMALRNTLISPPSQCDWTPHRTLEPSVRCLLGNGINLQTSARHKEKPLWVGISCVFRRIFLPRASIWSVLFLRRTRLVSLISIFELISQSNCKKHGYSPSFWDLLRNMVLARGWSDGLCAILSSVNTHKSVQYVHNDRKHMSAVHFKCSSNESTATANVLSVRGQKCAVCTGSSPQQMATFRLQSADRAASISRSVGRFITLKPPKHVLLSLIHNQTLAHDNPISLGLGFDANTRLANVTMTTLLLNISALTWSPCVLHFHYSFNVCICRICHKHEEKGDFLSFTFPSLPPSLSFPSSYFPAHSKENAGKSRRRIYWW